MQFNTKKENNLFCNKHENLFRVFFFPAIFPAISLNTFLQNWVNLRETDSKIYQKKCELPCHSLNIIQSDNNVN